jgi:predicted O-methyltransferase YrrM
MIDTDKIASEIESCVLIPSETDFLKEHADRAEHGLIEIGSQYGRSSVILGVVAKEKEIMLACIDKWEDADMFCKWQESIKKACLSDCVIPYKMLSNNVSKLSKKGFSGKFDFLFIDGDHSSEAVRFDYENWSAMLQRPAIVVFHDIDRGSVRVVFDEICKNNDYMIQKNIGAIYLT